MNNPTPAPILALWAEPRLQNDTLFDAAHPDNRDDCLYSNRVIRKAMENRGWEVHTQDVVKRAGVIPDAVLFTDIPRRPALSLVRSWAGKSRLFSFAVESPLVAPYVWDCKRHREFEAVFTWHSELVKRPGYVGIHIPHKIAPDIALKRDLAAKQKLCVMIVGNKRSPKKSPIDLYSKRLECIRWFEVHKPEDFDLYGIGWTDAAVRYSNRLRRLGLMKFVNAIVGVEPRPSYCGPVKEKAAVLERYRFNIAFENARDVPGYITEKLFDSFLGSTVPVYWGAPDVAEFVPKNCFIDFREFRDFETLYKRLSTMSDAEYLGYLDRIEMFLRGPQAKPFCAETLAETVADRITNRSKANRASE